MNLLFLAHHGQNSRDILLDIIAGARDGGHRVFVLPAEHLVAMCEQARDQRPAVQNSACRFLQEFISENEIDLTLAMWGNALQVAGLTQVDGRIVTFFEAIGSPLLNLWLDAPERAHAGSMLQHFRSPVVNSPYVFHFINNEGSAQEMAELFGFGHVLPIPYGTNPRVFRPVGGGGGTEKDFDIMFSVGGGEAWTTPTTAMLDEVRKDQPDLQRVRHDLAAHHVRPALEQLAAPVGASDRPAVTAVLEGLLAMQLADPAVPMVPRLATLAQRSAELQKGVGYLRRDLKLYVDAAQALRSVESFLRVFSFVYLARHFRCGIYGAIDLAAWDCPVKSAGFIAYDQQARMYSRAHIGLSVMRWQDEVGLHIKPYEIMASGAACLAQWRTGIDQLWAPGKEIATFADLPEARAKAAALLADKPALQTLAEAGRARTLRDHTWAKRLTVIADVIRKIRAANPKP